MYEFEFQDSEGNELLGLDFNNVKRGYQSQTYTFFVKNTGTMAIPSLVIQPVASIDYNVFNKSESYGAMLLSLNNIDYMEEVTIGLGVGQAIEIYTIWRPPSFSYIQSSPEVRIWDLLGSIDLSSISDDLCE